MVDDRQLQVLLEDAFNGVRCEQPLKDRTLDKILCGKAKKRQRMFANVTTTFSQMTKGLAAAMCCIIAIVATFGIYSAPAAAICLDGDMSMRLVVNRFDKVIDVTAYNDNAKNALEQLSSKVKGSSGRQVIKDVMEYKGTSDIEVYVITDNEKLSDAILADMDGEDGAYQVVSSNVNEDKNADADQNQMTYQRYEIFQKIQSLGIGLTEEQVRNMSIAELRAIVAEAELGSSDGTVDLENNEGVNGSDQSLDNTDDNLPEIDKEDNIDFPSAGMDDNEINIPDEGVEKPTIPENDLNEELNQNLENDVDENSKNEVNENSKNEVNKNLKNEDGINTGIVETIEKKISNNN